MRYHLLVIDDEETILSACEEYFSFLGLAVTTASSAYEAMALLRENTYDALIADLRLGSEGEEGLGIVREARARHSNIRIAIMSAYGSAEMVQEAKRNGAEQFFHKPVALSTLAKFIGHPPPHAVREKPPVF